MEKQIVTLRLKPEIYQAVKATAERTGIAMNALITQLILNKYGLEKQNNE